MKKLKIVLVALVIALFVPIISLMPINAADAGSYEAYEAHELFDEIAELGCCADCAIIVPITYDEHVDIEPTVSCFLFGHEARLWGDWILSSSGEGCGGMFRVYTRHATCRFCSAFMYERDYRSRPHNWVTIEWSNFHAVEECSFCRATRTVFRP